MNSTQEMKVVNVIPPAVIKDNASFTAVGVDRTGFHYATFYVTLGATDIAMAALKLQESDTDGSYADVDGADFSVSPLTLPTAGNDNGVVGIFVDLEKRKKWLTLVATAGDGSAGTYLSAVCLLSAGNIGPSDATSRGLISQAII